MVDADGRLVGLVTSETIGEMLMVREAMPQGFRFRPVEPAATGSVNHDIMANSGWSMTRRVWLIE